MDKHAYISSLYTVGAELRTYQLLDYSKSDASVRSGDQVRRHGVSECKQRASPMTVVVHGVFVLSRIVSAKQAI